MTEAMAEFARHRGPAYTACMRPADPLEPLWFRTAPSVFAAFAQPIAREVDVLIVGAGVTGLSTALHLADGSLRVAVIERSDVGRGTTGRSNGQVIAGLQQSPDMLLKAYGPEIGERLIEFAGAAPERLFALIARHAIACEAERHGWIQASRSTRGMKHLEQLARSWERRGVPIQLLDRDATASLTGTRTYAGSWMDPRNGTIQPFAYARGLAAACAKRGIPIHCGVELASLERRDGKWIATTNQGTISADAVVLATNVMTADLPGIAGATAGRSFLSAYSVQIATDPLPASVRAEVLPQRHALSDTSHLRLRYSRWDAEGRFVIGGPGFLTPPSSPKAMSFRILERAARKMFPALANATFVHHWAARDTVTLDIVPHLYEPQPGLFCAVGFNGRGLAIGTALGSVLARRILGEAPEQLPFPTTKASRSRFNVPATLRFYLGRAGRRFRH